ncbi:hypothetical protein RXV86_02985 [Alisedimentitalea sp. MJ-SS2]|uniref:tetratricopeptide repeat protein n=1 Tax=Aliisedimentitalea sp. MJ-SS2 TaxID=3049795 RepID=UPI002911838E|nr:hypothetical protein [Alisedimentitalea sp. MJ-SS2]MDU8926340.1 hypothetical protein [Alisedimentitalea sp. MJ-SS2]
MWHTGRKRDNLRRSKTLMHPRIEALLRAAALAFCFGCAAAPSVQADSVTLTIPQTRAAARDALAKGEFDLAVQLARGLLQANPKDAQAYYIIALAYQQLGDNRLGRKAAGYAFRYSEHPQDRYTTAQLAAKFALQQKRYTLAQYWLRRSIDHVPNEKLHQLAIADFKHLRADNPWQIRLQFSVAPTNNVNSGAGDPENEIDGTDLPAGILSPSAMALSGAISTGKINASYRLARTKNSETQLAFRAFAKQVTLSSAAKRLLATGPATVPPLTGRDFSSSFFSLGIVHTMRNGVRPDRPRGNGQTQLALTYGQSHFAGNLYYHTAKASVARLLSLSDSHAIKLKFRLEHRDYRTGSSSDTAAIQVEMSHQLANADRLSYGISLAATAATAINLRQELASGYVAYEPAKNLGPARISFILGASFSHYYDYRVGFFLVPGGRKDTTLHGMVSAHFEDYDFGGFSPTLTLHARETQSNVGRFDTDELTLSIGFKSNF